MAHAFPRHAFLPGLSTGVRQHFGFPSCGGTGCDSLLDRTGAGVGADAGSFVVAAAAAPLPGGGSGGSGGGCAGGAAAGFGFDRVGRSNLCGDAAVRGDCRGRAWPCTVAGRSSGALHVQAQAGGFRIRAALACHSVRRRARSGQVKQTAVPSPSTDSIQARPPRASMMRRTRVRPSPVPGISPRMSSRWKIWKTFSW